MTVAMQLWNRLTRIEIDDAHHDQLFIVLSPTCTACSALKVMEGAEARSARPHDEARTRRGGASGLKGELPSAP